MLRSSLAGLLLPDGRALVARNARSLHRGRAGERPDEPESVGDFAYCLFGAQAKGSGFWGTRGSGFRKGMQRHSQTFRRCLLLLALAEI